MTVKEGETTTMTMIGTEERKALSIEEIPDQGRDLMNVKEREKGKEIEIATVIRAEEEVNGLIFREPL